MSDEASVLGANSRSFGPSTRRAPLGSALRGVLLALMVGALVVSISMTGQSTARFMYPFLDAGPLVAPYVLFIPSYLPTQGQHRSVIWEPNAVGGELELRLGLVSSEDLVIWESVRWDATVEKAVGPYQDEGEVRGTLIDWHVGRLTNGGDALLHARLGQTLVVITGPLSIEELLRIADSLRPGSPSSLML